MMVVRLALVAVDDWPDAAPKLDDRRTDADFPELGPIHSPAVVEWLAGLGGVVHGTRPLGVLLDELGRAVAARSIPPGK